MKTLLYVAVVISLALVAVEARTEGTVQERKVSLVIESKTLADALDQWAQQTGFQIFVPNWELTKKITAPRLQGRFGAREALDRLLEGTSLMGVWTTDKAVTIRERVTPAAWQAYPGAPQVQKFAGDGLENRSAGASELDSSNSRLASPGATGMDAQRRSELEEVVVTGSHIRGSASVTSSVIVIGKGEIRRTGVASTRDLMLTLPQNFGGGINENTTVTPGVTASNGYAASANLRGLGSNATLVLLDGHRLPTTGVGGAVDISTIPLTAIERVEVLTDGASAIYGSDAIGGVVNFITDTSGAMESVAQYGTASGSLNELLFAQKVGSSWDSGHVSATLEYYDKDPLLAGMRSFTAALPPGEFITPDQNRKSAVLSMTQQVSSLGTFHASALYSDSQKEYRDLVSPYFNHYDGSQAAVNAGVGTALGEDWLLDVSALYGRNRQHGVTEAPTFATGRSATDTVNESYGLSARADGSFLTLAAGSVKGAIGVEYRKEKFEQSTQLSALTLEPDRDIYSLFAELLVPVARTLKLSIAGRYEDYSDFGSSTNPKVGLAWSPIDEVKVRATWGTSFHAPQFYDLYNETVAFVLPLPDPQAPTGETLVMFPIGGNPDLKAEEADTFSVGLDIQPAEVPWKVSLTYFDTRYDGRIATAYTDPFSVLVDEAVLGPQVVVRQPSAQFISEFLSRAPIVCCVDEFDPAALGAFINASQNIAQSRVRGLDLTSSIEWAIGDTSIDAAANISYLLENSRRVTPSSPEIDLINTLFNTPDFRARASLGVTHAWASGALFLNYTDNYQDTSVAPRGSVRSSFTVDAQLAVDLGKLGSGPALEGFVVSLSATNVFDRRPPKVAGTAGFFLSGAYGFDPANADPIGRLVSVQLRKRW